PHPGTGTWTASSSLLEDVQLANQTVRMVVRTSIGGEDLRLRLTNAFGLEPVTFGEVTVGEQQERAEVVEGSIRPVTFGGQATVTGASTRPRRSTTRFAARSKPSGSTPGTPSRLRSPSPSTRRQPSTSPPATRRRHRRRASRRPCRRRPVPRGARRLRRLRGRIRQVPLPLRAPGGACPLIHPRPDAQRRTTLSLSTALRGIAGLTAAAALLLTAAPAPPPAAATTFTATPTADAVVPIDWDRFVAGLPADAQAERARAILLNTNRHALQTWFPQTYGDQSGDYLDLGGVGEGNIRPPGSEALALATSLATGAYDPDVTGVPTADASDVAVRPIASTATTPHASLPP